ncbi:MAG: cytochrome b/b6 domain-containing protein [Actinomycetota bacterium]
MLAEVNVWADIIATALVGIALFFWVFQIVGNIVTGRFKRKFVGGEWPHHDAIVPPMPKIMHGVHVVSMISLWVSGLYIRFPFFSGGRDIMKYIHFVAMYAVIIIFVMRLWYAFTRDGREFVITLKDVKNFPRVLMYYMFLGKSYPHLMKYNPLQKMTYGYLFPVFLTIMAITGFGLMWPTSVYGWAANFTGGAAAAAAWGRVIHFLCAAILLMFTMIHLCLSFIEDYPALLIFFGLSKGDHGHEEHEENKEKDNKERKGHGHTGNVPSIETH